ncbi:unnamed protein product [Symbiodinium sp. KB8]|nr:unnamed protein product [Symbiodinium sp. KB8]
MCSVRRGGCSTRPGRTSSCRSSAFAPLLLSCAWPAWGAASSAALRAPLRHQRASVARGVQARKPEREPATDAALHANGHALGLTLEHQDTASSGYIEWRGIKLVAVMRHAYTARTLGEAHNLFRNDGLCIEFNVIPEKWYAHELKKPMLPACEGSGIQLSQQPSSQLVFRRHGVEAQADEDGPMKELWLLEPDRANNGARRTLLRAVVQEPKMLAGRAVLEMDSGAGMVGLAAAHLCRTMTLTAADDLGCRLLRFNAQSLHTATNASGRAKSCQAASVSGITGRQVPVYVYSMPQSTSGAGELARQWQWDSGTAMRSMRPSLVAPQFDVMLHAGRIAPEALLELSCELLTLGGVLLAVGNVVDGTDLAELVKLFSVERDEVLRDEAEGYFRLLQLRRRR